MRRAFVLAIFAALAVAGCQHDVILGEPAVDMAYPRNVDLTEAVPPHDIATSCTNCDLSLIDLAASKQDLAQ